MKINCIAIDDEPLALDIIINFANKIPFLDLKATFTKPLEAVDYLNNHTVDLLFLDIEMENITGIQFLKVLKNHPLVIFTTAYEHYALQGFELEAVDYLLKPFLFERFTSAVQKVRNRMGVGKQPSQNHPDSDFMFVKTGYRHKKVFFDDILYIEGQADYLKIVTLKENVMILQSFAGILKLLPEGDFMRVHKSHIVALRHIDLIERTRIKIADKYISVSESFGKSFFDLLKTKGLLT